MKDNMNRGRDHALERILSKGLLLPEASYRFSAIPIKLPTMVFFIKLEQKILQFVWKHRRPWITKTALRKIKLEESGSLTSDCTYSTATVIKTVWYWHESKRTCGHLIWRKRWDHTVIFSLFSEQCWEDWTASCQTKLGRTLLTPHTKINSEWIKDLNIGQTQ